MRRILCITIVIFSSISIVTPQGKHAHDTMYPSYKGLIMAGYQGWFRQTRNGSCIPMKTT